MAVAEQTELQKAERQERDRATALARERASLPVDNLNDALPFLRRPFTSAAVKFKVQAQFQNSGLIVAYIDARLVYERLNLVVGSKWSEGFLPYPNEEHPATNVLWCRLQVFEQAHGDIGEGEKKGLISDA